MCTTRARSGWAIRLGDNMYYVYMLLCSNDSLYTGITPDLEKRMRQHLGQVRGGAKYTALRPPKEIAAVWTAPDRSAAAKAEYAIKHLSPALKRQLAQAPDSLHALLQREEPLPLEVYASPTLEELTR